jgi:hypothetical protein
MDHSPGTQQGASQNPTSNDHILCRVEKVKRGSGFPFSFLLIQKINVTVLLKFPFNQWQKKDILI